LRHTLALLLETRLELLAAFSKGVDTDTDANKNDEATSKTD
jgi:hypothetical protein